ncbi:hypothetical protein SAMN02745136_03201 [Anaerocolumna jejuensis DSM 15929]|uniref:5-bromo-4-chloroindolyl phosphate hydrolysis protein n=1 Tax=Anaerocolumna jejuensis DSM 15929 TaxID=1121322 RepID=A0A1M6UVB1_9FIRM|nr:hypothetical protein [Anaerocolumna jejuensis]SHK73129.1 hypothetical protein SAMN02745136_03201 [Anaerocolumna jejuensis DSM 15929]
MKTRNRNVIGFISFILILITIALFFILTEKRVFIDWLGIGFIIAAELILMTGLLFIQRERGEQERTVLYAGMNSAIGLYTILSIIVSVLFMGLFREDAKYLLLIQIVLIAAYLITVVLIYNISIHVGKANASAVYSVNKMQELLNRIVMLRNINRNGALVQKLDKLYDAIRFSDVSATVKTDEIIAGKLTELQILIESDTEETAEAAGSLIDDVMVLIKQRAAELSIIKAGGI